MRFSHVNNSPTGNRFKRMVVDSEKSILCEDRSNATGKDLPERAAGAAHLRKVQPSSSKKESIFTT
jgi:hypothetical protein